jgi:hypothetical protein
MDIPALQRQSEDVEEKCQLLIEDIIELPPIHLGRRTLRQRLRQNSATLVVIFLLVSNLLTLTLLLLTWFPPHHRRTHHHHHPPTTPFDAPNMLPSTLALPALEPKIGMHALPTSSPPLPCCVYRPNIARKKQTRSSSDNRPSHRPRSTHTSGAVPLEHTIQLRQRLRSRRALERD